jgi:hypothetical protein
MWQKTPWMNGQLTQAEKAIEYTLMRVESLHGQNPNLPTGAQRHPIAREAELKTLEQFGHALRHHLKGVPCAQTSQRGRLDVGDTAQIGKLAEEALEPGWRNDL